MIQNRLRKLYHEEERMKREINNANKHSNFAANVNARRQKQAYDREHYSMAMESHRQFQLGINL
jgi:hypothetical protein